MQNILSPITNLANFIGSSLGISADALFSASIQMVMIFAVFVICIYLMGENLSEEKIRNRMKKSKTTHFISENMDQWSPTTFLNESLEHDLIEETRLRIEALNSSKPNKDRVNF